jgi:hypothetical protein
LVQIGPVVLEELIKMQKANDGRPVVLEELIKMQKANDGRPVVAIENFG